MEDLIVARCSKVHRIYVLGGHGNIDAITGATITSNAVYCSIEAALNQFEKCGGVK